MAWMRLESEHTKHCVCVRLLDEEVRKRTELEQIHLQQQQAISQTQQEKEQLEQQRLEQECTLQAAMQQLESLEQQRQGALEEYEASPPHTHTSHCFKYLNYIQIDIIHFTQNMFYKIKLSS